MKLVDTLWRAAKRHRAVPIGPVSVFYRMGRTVRVSNPAVVRLSGIPAYLENQLDCDGVLAAIRCNNRTQQAPPLPEVPLAEDTALVVGVGPRLGFALARKFASSDMNVALASRNGKRLEPLVTELQRATKRVVRGYGCDATSETSVGRLMSSVSSDAGNPSLVVYAVQGFAPGLAIDVDVSTFEECWRANCLGAFIVAREAARRMVLAGKGTIILVGSTSGMIGRAAHLNLAVGKFGLRALAQVLARELGVRGIHVVHVVIDADIRDEDGADTDTDTPQAVPEDIAELIYVLHRQPRSAWTSELDVRPSNEKFWEHC